MSRVENRAIFTGSKREFKLKRYGTLDYEVMSKVGMSDREWRICENIEYWANVESTGYVGITRAELGKLFGLSADRMKYIVADLVKRKFLKVNTNYHLAVASKWKKMMAQNGSTVPKNFLSEKTPKEDEEPKNEDGNNDDNKNEAFPFFEDEFGEDEKSAVDRPSLNQVRKKAVKLKEKKNIDEKQAIEIATAFWRKKESIKWANTSNSFLALKRYIDVWLKNIEKYPEKFHEREKNIKTPTNSEEMRLWIKQMDESKRECVVVPTANKGNVIIDSRTGMPVLQDSGEYLNDTEYENFMEFCLKNHKNL